jgi:hypothetical protein
LNAAVLSQTVLAAVSALLGGSLLESEIRRATRLTRGQWRDLGRAFPGLGGDPGPAAARARRRYGRLVGRALANGRSDFVFRGGVPDPEPGVYATAHVGDLRSLRYLLRPRLPIATVIRPDERAGRVGGDAHPEFERCGPGEFPQTFSSSEPHRLRSALERGSLIVSADLPEEDARAFPCLGGSLRLDPRPFRLARLARVRCQPLFLTSPRGRLTITIGPALPGSEEDAVAAFAQSLAGIAEETPLEIDGYTWWHRLGLAQ